MATTAPPQTRHRSSNEQRPQSAMEFLRYAKLRVKDLPEFLAWLHSEPAFSPIRNDPALRAILSN
jgi:hypothetical protein